MMLDDSSMSQFCSVTFNQPFTYQDVSKYLVFLKKKKYDQFYHLKDNWK